MEPISLTSNLGTKDRLDGRGWKKGSVASMRRKKGAKSLAGNRGKKVVMARAGTVDLATGRQIARGRQEVVR